MQGYLFGIFLIVPLLAFIVNQSADGATIKQTVEGGVDINITYPDSVIAGRDFSISVLVQNNGWEDKQDVKFSVDTQSDSIVAKNQTLYAKRLSKGGSFGGILEFTTFKESQIGTNYLNLVYSQILLSNNQTPLPLFQKNIAIPVEIKSLAEIQINTVTQSTIFPNAEFPFKAEIISKDVVMKNVVVRINPPPDITIRGQTLFTYSEVGKNEPVLIHTQIITSPAEVTSEHKLPFEVVVEYTDEDGEKKTTSRIIPLLLRPRTFMEFTTDGGIWIGNIFLAPYVSIGTLIGIPAGAIFSLIIRKIQKKKESKRKKK